MINALSNDNTQQQVLVRNATTGLVEYRLSTSLPSIGVGRYHLNTSQSISNATVTTLVYDTIDTATSNITYSTGIFTINTAGIYIFDAGIIFASNAVGERYVNFKKNTGVNSVQSFRLNTNATDVWQVNNTYNDLFAVNDTLLIQLYQTSTGTLNASGVSTSSANYCNMTVNYIISA